MKKYLFSLAMLGFSALGVYAQNYSGGSGVKGDPYQIATKADLKYLSETMGEASKHFIQTADIYFSSADFAPGGDFYNDGKGFNPLGQVSGEFRGSYNGGGHIIDSLVMNRPSQNVAFINNFRPLITGDSIANLGLTHVNLFGSGPFAGILIGQTSGDGLVLNCYTTGSIECGNYTAGLIGLNDGAIVRNCYSTAKVKGVVYSAGLIGSSQKNVSHCYATGDVEGTTYSAGLIGSCYSGAEIDSCYATGSAVGDFYVAGLIGSITGGRVSSCYASGQVTATGTSGGLLGSASSNTLIENSFATNNVTGTTSVGGLIGSTGDISVLRSYATGHVTGTTFTGGLIGSTGETVIQNCYALGNVSGTSYAGGLIGSPSGSTSISNCYAIGQVTATGSAGGLFGAASAGLGSTCYWNSETSGIATGQYGTPKTTVEMQRQATYVGWDFAQTWKMGNCITNNGYPILAYQILNIPTATVNYTLSASVQNELCGGTNSGAIDLTVNGSSKYKFTWSSGDYTEDVQNLSAGTYTLTVVDTANCGTTDTSFTIGIDSYFPSTGQVTASSVCISGPSSIEMTQSANGAMYFLRDSNNMIVDGPVLGTGGTVNFTTGNLNATTTFNILGALFNGGTSLDTVSMNGLEFRGNGDTTKVRIPQAMWTDSFVNKQNLTVEAWINRASGANLQTILSNYGALGGSYPLLLRMEGNKLNFYINSGGSSAQSTSDVPMGEWVHVAAVYENGTTLKVYINGQLEGTRSQSGSLIASSDDIRIGGGISNKTEHFTGGIAEVRLWNSARTEEEIQDNMKLKLAGTEPGLVGYYEFNEGSGTIASNSASALFDGTLMSAPSWIAGPVHTDVICSDVYASPVTAIVGNDLPDSTTSVSMQTITSNEASGTYQWVDCNDNNKPIQGATGKSFTATQNGSYAVIVGNGVCSVMSECVNITNVGIEELSSGEVHIYPNPTRGMLRIDVRNANNTIHSVKVLSVLGEELSLWQGSDKTVQLDLSTLAKGVYFIAIQAEGQSITKRIVKE